MAIITSPENRLILDRYREISRRLAKAKGVSEEEARALSQEGKAVVWIDGGLHATEVLGAQQLMEMVYRMVSRCCGPSSPRWPISWRGQPEQSLIVLPGF